MREIRMSATVFALVVATAAPSSAAQSVYGSLLGTWRDPQTRQTIAFATNDKINDSLHKGRPGTNSAALRYGANLSISYPGGRWCHFTALVSKDQTRMFLARKTSTPDWPCLQGAFVKIY